ncbi:MAG: 3-ketoacyl-ACP reductase [Planctomycetota bacterium]
MTDKRVAIVTGGSRGIGRAICAELGRLGFAVVVNYATRPDAADETVASIEAAGGEAIAVKASVAVAEDRAALMEQTLSKFGRLDLLVNNAGITSQGRKDILEATTESWDVVFNTNLKGPFFLSQAAANEMVAAIEGGRIPDGKIIIITSISAYAVSVNRADYCMTKAALSMMTQLFAQRLGPHGVNVYEICPGVIESDMTAPVKEKYDKLIAEGIWPIRRWGKPDDVARAVAAVATDLFPFTTGSRFDVDGGFHVRAL